VKLPDKYKLVVDHDTVTLLTQAHDSRFAKEDFPLFVAKLREAFLVTASPHTKTCILNLNAFEAGMIKAWVMDSNKLQISIEDQINKIITQVYRESGYDIKGDVQEVQQPDEEKQSDTTNLHGNS